MNDIRVGDELRLPVTVLQTDEGGAVVRIADRSDIEMTVWVSRSTLEAAERLPRKLAVGNEVTGLMGNPRGSMIGKIEYQRHNGSLLVGWEDGTASVHTQEGLRLADPRTGERA